MARYVGPEDPTRRKYDPVVVGAFIPVVKKVFRN